MKPIKKVVIKTEELAIYQVLKYSVLHLLAVVDTEEVQGDSLDPSF